VIDDIAGILEDLKIEVVGESENRQTGALEYKARCPWHKDGTAYDFNPGWYINSETGEHICFSCRFSGTLQVLAYRLLDLDWDQAGAWVNDRSDVLARFSERDAWAKEDRAERKTRVPMAPINDARILAFDDVPDEELIGRRLTRAGAAQYEIRWDSKKAAWILPIRSENNALLGWQIKGTGEDKFFRNYPMGVAKGSCLFGFHTLSGSGEVWVVESPLDAARLHALGYEAVATFGATVTETQMELLIANSRSLMIAMDNDDAGKRSALWMLGLDAKGKPARKGQDYSKRTRLRFFQYTDSKHKDPGDMAGHQIADGITAAKSSIHGARAVLA
jgi:DNA primase